jgi:hypothetical protein
VRIVQVHLRDGQEFLSRYGRKNEQDELFLGEALDCEVGEEVALDLYFDHSGYAFRVQSRIISRRLTRAGNLPPGARVALIQRAEGLAGMIVAHARGEEIRYFPRTGERVDCRFPIRIRAGSTGGRGEVVDLSPGGIRAAGISPPPLGTQLVLRLYPPGVVLGVGLRGRVVWHGQTPAAGMGVQFVSVTARQTRRLRDLMHRLGHRG